MEVAILEYQICSENVDVLFNYPMNDSKIINTLSFKERYLISKLNLERIRKS